MFRNIFVSILVIFSASWATASLAQEQFGVWRYDCNQGPCQGHFTLKLPETGELAIGMSVVHEQAVAATTVILKTPIFTALPPGIRLNVGDDLSEQVIMQFCDNSGCTGFLRLTDEQVEQFRDNDMATVSYFKYGQTTPTAYNFSIDGFGAVLDRLKRPK